MFFSGGLFILLAVLFLPLVGAFLFSRKFAWFGQLPGDIRYGGRRTRVYAPLASKAPAVAGLESVDVPARRDFLGGPSTGGKYSIMTLTGKDSVLCSQ